MNRAPTAGYAGPCPSLAWAQAHPDQGALSHPTERAWATFCASPPGDESPGYCAAPDEFSSIDSPRRNPIQPAPFGSAGNSSPRGHRDATPDPIGTNRTLFRRGATCRAHNRRPHRHRHEQDVPTAGTRKACPCDAIRHRIGQLQFSGQRLVETRHVAPPPDSASSPALPTRVCVVLLSIGAHPAFLSALCPFAWSLKCPLVLVFDPTDCNRSARSFAARLTRCQADRS